MRSALQQFVHHPDGSISVEGYPDVALEVIADQGHATGRDITTALGLPTYFEDWEVLAQSRGVSARHARFILMDESETKFPGHYRLQPQRVTLPPLCYLEFAHRGFIVGVVHSFILGFRDNLDTLTHMGIAVPADVEGDYLIGQATLFESPLAEKAWDGLRTGLFTHVCPALLRQPDELAGTGRLMEVSLTTDDNPGCPGARILKTWEG
jgi:hypothetical protein